MPEDFPYERDVDAAAEEAARRPNPGRPPPLYMHARAMQIAEALQDALAPACERIEIAGSIRRQAPQVKDVELVAVPKTRKDLFGHPIDDEDTELDLLLQKFAELNRLVPRVDAAGRLRLGRRFKALRAVRSQLPIDLFLVLMPAQWGAIFAIRTGPAAYSQQLVTECQRKGLRCTRGHLEDIRGRTVDTPEEQDFIRACGLEVIEPRNRR